jgi:hypothetical protein
MLLALSLAIGIVATAVGSGSIPPVNLGEEGSAVVVVNDQTVEVLTNIPVTVYFMEISPNRVTGTAVRTCTGNCTGTVRIRWINRNRETYVVLSETRPEAIFGMENGDVDKRGGHNLYSDIPSGPNP